MLSDRQFMIVGGAVLLLAALGYFAAKRAGQALVANASLVNPLSTNNLVYRGANAVGAAVTGDESFSLGAKLFEWTHPAALDAERALSAPIEGELHTLSVDESAEARRVGDAIRAAGLVP